MIFGKGPREICGIKGKPEIQFVTKDTLKACLNLDCNYNHSWLLVNGKDTAKFKAKQNIPGDILGLVSTSRRSSATNQNKV